jgi:hypothetical protein
MTVTEFCSLGVKSGPYLAWTRVIGPSQQMLEKMREKSISGVPPGGPTYFTVGAVGKISTILI